MANDVNITISADGSQAKRELQSVGDAAGTSTEHVSKLGSAIGGMTTIAGGIVASQAFDKLAGSIQGAFSSALDYQKLQAQTNAVLLSTGDASGQSAQSIKELANQLSDMSGVQDETIQGGANLLLTFTNIKGDVFPAATAAALDMSAAMDAAGKSMNISETATLVGKALQDPVAGLSALHRVGVDFTDSQKELIKQMVAVGDTAGAQKVILGELNTEYGGSAKAAGDTLGGSLDKLKNQWNDMQRDLAVKLIPTLTQVAEWLSVNVPKAMAAISAYYDANLKPTFEKLSADVQKVVQFFQDHWDKIGPIVKDAADQIQNAVKIITDVLTIVIDLLSGDWSGAWKAMKQLVADVWDGIQIEIKSQIDKIKLLGSLLLEAGQNIMKGLKDGLVGVWNDWIQPFLESLPGRMWAAGAAMMSAIIDGLTSKLGDLKGWVSDHLNPTNWDIPGFSPLMTAMREAGQQAGGTFVSGLGDGLSVVGATVSKALGGFYDPGVLGNPGYNFDPSTGTATMTHQSGFLAGQTQAQLGYTGAAAEAAKSITVVFNGPVKGPNEVVDSIRSAGLAVAL